MQSTRRGSLSVHRSEKTPGSKYSSTSGLSPRGHLERQAEFHASTQDAGGGDMIREVHKYETTWNDLPYKFEAGTPNIADVIGFAAALDYLDKIGMDKVREHEMELTKYALDKLSQMKGIILYGPKDVSKRGGVISFNLGDIHPHDLATIIDEDGIAIRSGHHCAQVLMERLDVSATSSASFYIYNTKEEVDVFIRSLNRAKELFKL